MNIYFADKDQKIHFINYFDNLIDNLTDNSTESYALTLVKDTVNEFLLNKFSENSATIINYINDKNKEQICNGKNEKTYLPGYYILKNNSVYKLTEKLNKGYLYSTTECKMEKIGKIIIISQQIETIDQPLDIKFFNRELGEFYFDSVEGKIWLINNLPWFASEETKICDQITSENNNNFTLKCIENKKSESIVIDTLLNYCIQIFNLRAFDDKNIIEIAHIVKQLHEFVLNNELDCELYDSFQSQFILFANNDKVIEKKEEINNIIDINSLTPNIFEELPNLSLEVVDLIHDYNLEGANIKYCFDGFNIIFENSEGPKKLLNLFENDKDKFTSDEDIRYTEIKNHILKFIY